MLRRHKGVLLEKPRKFCKSVRYIAALRYEGFLSGVVFILVGLLKERKSWIHVNRYLIVTGLIVVLVWGGLKINLIDNNHTKYLMARDAKAVV